MDFVFPWPMSQGEWLAWSGAVATGLIGLAFMLAPGLMLSAYGVDWRGGRPQVLSEARATMGGFHVGFALTAILFAQPLVYLALAFAWAVAAFARLISILSDDAAGLRNWLLLVVAIVLAGLPAVFALGIVP